MKSVGLVGGLGPESTIDYYRRIIARWQEQDPESYPRIVIDSLDFKRGIRLVQGDRPGLVEYLLGSIRRLAGAGWTSLPCRPTRRISSTTSSWRNRRCRC